MIIDFKKFKLPTLKYRRARGYMIGYFDNINNISFLSHVDVATRDNKYKLNQRSVKCDLRVVSLLNSLPDGVCDSDTINCFKS